MKSALLAASLVLVGATALGCSGGGGGAGAPTDATEEDYCAGYQSLFDDMSTMADATDAEIIAQIKDWATTMEETGTPEDMPEDARAGFETTMTLIRRPRRRRPSRRTSRRSTRTSARTRPRRSTSSTPTRPTPAAPRWTTWRSPRSRRRPRASRRRRAPVDDRGSAWSSLALGLELVVVLDVADGLLDLAERVLGGVLGLVCDVPWGAHPGGAPSPALGGVEDDPALDPVVGERRSDVWLVVATASVSASTSAAGSTRPRSSTSVVAP